MGKYRKQESLRAISTIDVTPLVDLTFLLLIVFMITAPVLEFALDVSPPELDAAPIDANEHRLINLTRDGQIVYRDQTLDLPGLGSELEQLAATNPRVQVFVRADERRPYGEVMAIMRTVQRAGIEQVSLVTEAEEPD